MNTFFKSIAKSIEALSTILFPKKTSQPIPVYVRDKNPKNRPF